MTTLPRRALRDSPTFAALAITVLAIAAAASTLALFPREVSAAAPSALSQSQQSEFERFMTSSPRVPITEASEGAKVVIIMFNDFQCPPCAQSYLGYESILAKYQTEQPGAVRFVVKDYPLDAECNSNVGSTIHVSACDAAVAVRLAREHNRADQMMDWLYTNQQSLTPASVRQAAHDAGQVNDFDARYATTLQVIKEDIALGKQLGVRVLPTFFVNGVKIEGKLPPQYFEEAIQLELGHAGTK